ncbi:MAG: hypothetical protein EA343_15435 [Nodularia sp. (in: Bacteria)]|nr:MAG: hypothetical protein EA343_15435 [Nodularia sp. (in: cyanobacteria)]
MNSGNYKLAQSYYPLALQPEANINFANSLSNQTIQAALYLVENSQFIYVKAVFIYLDHTLVSVFLSSFAPLRLCVRYKNVVHLAENRCKEATDQNKFKYCHAKSLSTTVENWDASFFLDHWLEEWRNIMVKPEMFILSCQNYFTFKYRDRLRHGFAERTQKIKSFYWKLPLPT